MHKIIIGFLFFILMNSAIAGCHDLYNENSLNLKELVSQALENQSFTQNDHIGVKATKNSLYFYENPIVDATSFSSKIKSDYSARFRLEDGNLVFSVILKGQDSRSQYLRGSELFETAMEYFKGRVFGIEGIWKYGDNLKAFNELTANQNNLDITTSALNTWTGRQAVKFGFNKVTRVELVGQVGRYSYAHFLFTR